MGSVTGSNGAYGAPYGTSQQTSGEGTESKAGAIAHQAAEQARKVGQVASQAARGKIDEARSKVMEQADSRKGVLVQGLTEVATALEQAAEGVQTSELPRRLFQQAAQTVRSVSDSIEHRTPEELLQQAREQLRARPSVAIAGLFAVGFLAGRMLKV